MNWWKSWNWLLRFPLKSECLDLVLKRVSQDVKVKNVIDMYEWKVIEDTSLRYDWIGILEWDMISNKWWIESMFGILVHGIDLWKIGLEWYLTVLCEYFLGLKENGGKLDYDSSVRRCFVVMGFLEWSKCFKKLWLLFWLFNYW